MESIVDPLTALKNEELEEADIENLEGIDLKNLPEDKSEEELVQSLRKSLIQKKRERQQNVVSDNPYLTEEIMKLGGIDASEIIVINDHVGNTEAQEQQ